MAVRSKTIFSLCFLMTSLLCSCQTMVSPIGGSFNDNIEEAKKELSPETKEFIEKAFADFNFQKECLVDFHLHAVGMGVHKGKTWVNPAMSSLSDPHTYIKYNVFKSAGGIQSNETADDDYIERLVRLQRAKSRQASSLCL